MPGKHPHPSPPPNIKPNKQQKTHRPQRTSNAYWVRSGLQSLNMLKKHLLIFKNLKVEPCNISLILDHLFCLFMYPSIIPFLSLSFSTYSLVKKKVNTKKKRSHTIIFCWTTFSLSYGMHLLFVIVLMRLSNVQKFISIQRWIIFLNQDFASMMVESEPSPAHSKNSEWG